ncbi:unnamed protein product, partial [Rotaria sp. Silwood1]
LLTNKCHRIYFRICGELNANLKNLDGQIHNEIERIERALQTENDFHHLDKELDSYLQISSEQLKSSQHHQDKGIIFQTVSDRLQQAEHELNKLIQLSERLINDLPRSQYDQLKRIIVVLVFVFINTIYFSFNVIRSASFNVDATIP